MITETFILDLIYLIGLNIILVLWLWVKDQNRYK